MNGFAPKLMQTQRIRSLDNFYPQNSYPTKSKMAAAAILKITFLAITRPLLHILAPNLIDGLKRGLRNHICHQNFTYAKIQDGGTCQFEISYSVVILTFVNRFAPDLTQRPKLRFWIRFYQQN